MQRRRSVTQQRRGSSASARDYFLGAETHRSRSRRGSTASRGGRSRSVSRSRSRTRRGSTASRTATPDDGFEDFLRGICMEEHVDLLIENGFSSLEILSFATVEDLESLGLLKGHAVAIARAPKSGVSKVFQPLGFYDEDGSESDDSDELEDAAPTSDFQLKASKKKTQRRECLTELRREVRTGGGLAPKIVVGNNDEITLWRPGSVIKFKIQPEFPRKHQQTVEAACRRAVDAWNGKGVGVTFAETNDKKKATFLIRYRRTSTATRFFDDDDPDALAEAFFPDEYNPAKPSEVLIFQGAVDDPQDLKELHETMMHELGHVLGLRHEFALKEEKDDRAVRFGKKDKNSVMTYNDRVTITAKDAKFTKALYAKRAGSKVSQIAGFKLRRMWIRHIDPERI